MRREEDWNPDDPDGELNLRELVKGDYTERQRTEPMGESFRAVGSHAHNLKNVHSLRERYGNEYAAKMSASAVEPKGGMDSQWYAITFAGRVLKGIFDTDEVAYIKKHVGDDKLGIPQDFLDLPEVQRFMNKLVNRSSVNNSVRTYLCDAFNIKQSPQP